MIPSVIINSQNDCTKPPPAYNSPNSTRLNLFRRLGFFALLVNACAVLAYVGNDILFEQSIERLSRSSNSENVTVHHENINGTSSTGPSQTKYKLVTECPSLSSSVNTNHPRFNGALISNCHESMIEGHFDFIISRYIDSLTSTDANQQRTIIYEVTNGGSGGLGDRLRGLTFSFIIALLTHSNFILRHVNGGEWGMDRVFTPSKNELKIESVKARAKLTDDDIQNAGTAYYLIDNFDVQFYRNNNFYIEIREKGKPKVIKIRTNTFRWMQLLENPSLAESVKYYQLASLTNFDLFRLALKAVWSVPNIDMIRELEKYKYENTHLLRSVGIQMRLGDQEFRGRKGAHTLRVATCFAKQIASYCDDRGVSFKLPCSIFITSDSADAIRIVNETLFAGLLSGNRKATNLPRVFTSEGDITHVDIAPSGSRIAALKTYVDWYLLSTMELSFISRSGYGETPSWQGRHETWKFSNTIANDCYFYKYDNLIGFTENSSWDVEKT